MDVQHLRATGETLEERSTQRLTSARLQQLPLGGFEEREPQAADTAGVGANKA